MHNVAPKRRSLFQMCFKNLLAFNFLNNYHYCFLSFFFFNRHLVQAYRVKTVQSVFPITVKINTDAIVFLATQADTVKQVYIHASNTLNLEKCYYVLFRNDFLETV